MREKVSLGRLARFLVGPWRRAGRDTWGNARSGNCETFEMRLWVSRLVMFGVFWGVWRCLANDLQCTHAVL